jgi:hypothetical protein
VPAISRKKKNEIAEQRGEGRLFLVPANDFKKKKKKKGRERDRRRWRKLQERKEKKK